MYNKPTKEELSNIPKLYETEAISSDDKMAHMHFFFHSSDWYVFEYDGDDTFFGYVILSGDTQKADLGYFSLSELDEINIKGFEVDRDLYWELKKFSAIREEKGL